MSKFELFLTVGVCVAPILSLIFVFPKGFKFKKKQKAEVKTAKEANETFNYIKENKEEPKQVEVKLEKKEDFKDLDVPNFDSSDFKDYLNRRPKGKGPMRKLMNDDFGFPYDGFGNRKKEKEDKSIKEQINDLSPELKAMLIAGVLDRKKY